MALTERSRAALFRGLSEALDDEEAVGELLSYFPSRDVDEPASRDFVDARMSRLEASVTALEARMDAGFASVDARMAALFAEQRESLAATMHAEIRTMTRWAVGTIIASAGLLLALGVVP